MGIRSMHFLFLSFLKNSPFHFRYVRYNEDKSLPEFIITRICLQSKTRKVIRVFLLALLYHFRVAFTVLRCSRTEGTLRCSAARRLELAQNSGAKLKHDVFTPGRCIQARAAHLSRCAFHLFDCCQSST